MTYFFENQILNYLFYLAHSYVSTFCHMLFLSLFLKRRFNIFLTTLITSVLYIAMTLLMEDLAHDFMRGILSWITSGMLALALAVFMLFRGRRDERALGLIVLYMGISLVEGGWIVLNAALMWFYTYITSRIWAYILVSFIAKPGLTLLSAAIFKRHVSVENFTFAANAEKRALLAGSLFAVMYVYGISNFAALVYEVRFWYKSALVANSVYGLAIAAYGFLNAYLLYKQIMAGFAAEREKRLLAQRHELAQMRAARGRSYDEEVSALRMEMSGLLDDILNRINDSGVQEAAALISQRTPGIPNAETTPLTGNRVIDYFLCKTEELAKEKNIKFSFTNSRIGNFDVGEIDLCTIVSNILDNAAAANAHVTEGDRYISFAVHKNDGILYIGCENAKTADVSRSGRRGYGLANIREASAKYNGDVQTAVSETSYKIEVLLYETIAASVSYAK